jgi:hypothetical protein
MMTICKATACAGLVAVGILASTVATGAVSHVDAAVLILVVVAEVVSPLVVTAFADTLD